MASKVEQILTFAYEGTDRRGQKVKGEVSGKNMALAKAQLRKQGISANKVYKKRSNPLASLSKKKITALDISIFTRQLATMMKAGVPLVQSFEIVADGWLARIFQHENDHLDGVLYADRLEHPFGKAAAKAVKKQSWGGPGKSWLPGRDTPES